MFSSTGGPEYDCSYWVFSKCTTWNPLKHRNDQRSEEKLQKVPSLSSSLSFHFSFILCGNFRTRRQTPESLFDKYWIFQNLNGSLTRLTHGQTRHTHHPHTHNASVILKPPQVRRLLLYFVAHLSVSLLSDTHTHKHRSDSGMHVANVCVFVFAVILTEHTKNVWWARCCFLYVCVRMCVYMFRCLCVEFCILIETEKYKVTRWVFEVV